MGQIMAGSYTGGCEAGSTTDKAVIINEHGAVMTSSIMLSVIDIELSSQLVLEKFSLFNFHRPSWYQAHRQTPGIMTPRFIVDLLYGNNICVYH
jgi:hypothetical protein